MTFQNVRRTDDDEFFPFNNGQKRIGGDGAKIIPGDGEKRREKKEIVIFCRIPSVADIFQTFYAHPSSF